MKKLLLSLATVVFAFTGAMAEKATFSFTTATSGTEYGLTQQASNQPTADIDLPKTISDGTIDMTLNATSGGFAYAGNRVGSYALYICKNTENPTLTLSLPNATITNVAVTMGNQYHFFYVDGVESEGTSYEKTWSGSKKDQIELTFDSTDGTTYRQIKNVTVTYELSKEPVKLTELFMMVEPAKSEVNDDELGDEGLRMGFMFKEEDLVQTESEDMKMTLAFDGKVIAEIPAGSPAIEFEEPMRVGNMIIEGSVYILFSEVVKDFDLKTPGEYTLTIPTGFYTLNGENVEGATYTVTILKKADINFTYTLNPAAGAEVETLAEIVLQFPDEHNINYASSYSNPVATLTSEDGSVVLDCVYPATDWNNTLTLKFGEADTKWVNGKYTLKVNGGTINLNDPYFDDSAIGTGNFDGLTAEYILNAKATEMGEIKDYITLSAPSSFEANPINTVLPTWGACGMGVIGLGLKTTDFVGVEGAEFIKYYYQADENSARELLTTANPTNENAVVIIGRGIMDESDLPSFDPTNMVYFVLCNNGDGEIDTEEIPKYTRDGYYTLEIPDGAFAADGILLKGIELTYHFTNETSSFNYEYTLEPNAALTEENPIRDAASVFGQKGSGIVLTFVGSNQIDCVTNAATLTCPDGTVLTRNTPISNWRTQFTWKFGTNNTEWQHGEYVFEILPGKIYVDMGFAEDMEDAGIEGNFPGIKAIYYVGESSSVALIGVDKADSYTIYTIDGRIVKRNATMGQILDVEPGLYIVNGKKAYIRK